MRRIVCILCASAILLLAGCTKEEKPQQETGRPSVSAQGGNNTEVVKQPLYEKAELLNTAKGAFSFAADRNGEVYVLGQDGALTVYGKDGKEKKTYPDCLDFMALCCEEGELYAYDGVTNELISFNTEDGSRKTILESLYAQEILKIVKSGDALYILLIPEHMQSMAGNNDYHDFGESLYKVTLADGSCEELLVDGVIAIYASEEESLYYYAYQEETYVLCQYDTKTGESSVCHDMMAEFGVKYLSAFVYETGVFAYAELNTPAVHVLSTEDGTGEKKTDGILLLSGNDMDCVRGNVIYLGYPADGSENFLRGFYLFE